MVKLKQDLVADMEEELRKAFWDDPDLSVRRARQALRLAFNHSLRHETISKIKREVLDELERVFDDPTEEIEPVALIGTVSKPVEPRGTRAEDKSLNLVPLLVILLGLGAAALVIIALIEALSH